MKNNIIWNSLIISIIFILMIGGFSTHRSLSYLKSSITISTMKSTVTLCQVTNSSITIEKPVSSHNKDNNSYEQTNEKDNLVVIFPNYMETINKNIEQDNTYIINNPESTLVLVNKQRKLPENFVPSQLITPNVNFSNEGAKEKNQMKAVAALALEKLFISAEENGHILYAVSGYRSFKRQKSIYNNFVSKSGKEKAETFSARPGTSEHQTGLAMDISVESQSFLLTEKFGETPEGIWVKNNAHRFGFILRYPKEKVDITGYIYEPWHIRYIGINHASYLFKNNLVLEEVINPPILK